MKYLTIFFAISILAIDTYSQINIGGEPPSWNVNFKTNKTPKINLPKLDMEAIKHEDKRDKENGLPPRFGFKHDVNISIKNSGVWVETENSDRIWQLEISSPEALSINLIFKEFWLPEGGVLYIYSKDKSHLIGGFNFRNNKGERKDPRGFGTDFLYNDHIVIEYYEPKEVRNQSIIKISGIVHGYRMIRNKSMDFDDPGECQVNVNCSPEGDVWQHEKKGVALYIIDGVRFCSGSLVNNENRDGELFFLTADHCIDAVGLDAEGDNDASNFIFLWNYESGNCSNPQSEPMHYTTTGATIVANNDNTDFALLLLDESPLELQMPDPVFFNGWSRTNTPSQGGVGIHHPKGDIKKISTHNMTPIDDSECPDNSNNYWEVSWVSTTNGYSVTQNVSSGSPLFDGNKKMIIGQLYGPFFCDGFQCDSPEDQRVVYGRISSSWNGSQSTRRLKDWLDPDNTGVFEIEGGYYTCTETLTISYPINNGGTIQAEKIINANNTITNGADVEYLAGEEINLIPGFEVQQGAEFEAKIEQCTPEVILPATKQNIDYNKEVKNDLTNSVLNLYPNPSSNTLYVEFSEVQKQGVLSIYDMLGRNLYEINRGNKHKYSIDVSSFASGIYILNYQTKEHSESKRFVVEK